jgi:NitT/TauT family transport system substrate-binding protein
MKKLFLPSIIVIAIASLFIFLYVEHETPIIKVDKVTIAQAGDFFLYAPLYVALDAGIFSEEGVEVLLTTTGGDDKTWAAVVSGSAQFGVADPTFIAVSTERGQPGRVVASIVNGVPFWGVTYRDDIKAIMTPKDLNGYSVATFPSPSTAFTLQAAMFKSANLEPQIVQGAFGTLLNILEAKRADIALELEPNVSVAVARGAHVVYSMSNIYGDFAITGLTTTPELIRNRPDTVRKIVWSLTRAMRLIRNDRPKALALLTKRFPEIKPEVAAQALDRAIADGIIPMDAITSESAWEKALKLRVDSGDLKSTGRFLDYVDNAYATEGASRK